jgi:5,10-methylenetetrahydromethanopterin reductase
MQFGIRMPATHSLQEMVGVVRRAEAAGFDAAWFPDSHLNYREVWTTLGAVAVSTERIQIGPTVTNLVGRHVTITASAARTVAEAAPGRFLLGIGAGDSAIGFDGMRNSTLAELETGVDRLRRLLAGDGVAFGNFEARLRRANNPAPIYVAASGPKTLALAGRIADGVIIMMGNVARKIEHVRRGAAAASREPPPVHVYTTGAVVDDLERVSRQFKPACIRLAELEGPGIFEEAGLTPPAVGDHVMGAQGDLGHAADVAEAAAAVDHRVSDEAARWFVRNYVIVGSEADVTAHLTRLQTLGVSGVTLTQHSGDRLPDKLIETLGPLTRRFAR